MTLADDMEPGACIGMCSEVIQRSVVGILNHLLEPDDSPKKQAEKLVILGKHLRNVKEYTKEALKAVENGQNYTAALLLRESEHRTLDQFPEVTSVTITGPDGIEHEIDPKTAPKNLDIAEKMIREGGA